MNKKAQLGLPMYVIIAVFAGGFILSVLTPTLNEVRSAQLAATADSEVLMKLVLYMLIPIVWFFYVLLSIFAINAAREQSI
jgi:hypothetical protein